MTKRAVDPRLRAVFRVLVGIEGWIIAHRKDLARARIHNDDRDSFGMGLLGSGCNLLLNDVLNVLIDGRDQVCARRHGLLNTVEASASRIGHDQNSSGFAADAVVVPIFETA